jgi:hypothetical protein
VESLAERIAWGLICHDTSQPQVNNGVAEIGVASEQGFEGFVFAWVICPLSSVAQQLFMSTCIRSLCEQAWEAGF